MHSVFGVVTRKSTKDYKLPDSNAVITRGTQILLPLTALHYDSNYFEEPTKFKPERFNEESIAQKSFVDMPYLPFGYGKRSCVLHAKLQTKISIVLLLQKFRFELGSQHENEELKLNVAGIVKTPVDGINLRVIFRAKINNE